MGDMIKVIGDVLGKMPDAQKLAALALCVTVVIALAILASKKRSEPWAKAWLRITGAVVLLNVAGGLWLALRPEPPSPVELPVSLRLQFKSTQAAAPQDTMLLWHERPVDLGKSVLDAFQPGPGLVEYRAQLGQLPPENTRYEGLVFRQVTSARLGEPPGVTHVCFVSTPSHRVLERAVTMACVEDHDCQVSDPAGLAAACTPEADGKKVAGLLTGLLPMARAQAATDAAPPSRGWVAPSLGTLRKLQDTGRGRAYTEFMLKSPPIASLGSARRVQYSLRVNGTSVWIDGLPDEANTVAFDARQGLQLALGLENLGFSGAHTGHEDVSITLRFRTEEGRELRTATLRLDAVALRDQPTPSPAGDADLGITWTARYVPQAHDAYQVFITMATSGPQAMEIKKRFDESGFRAAAGPGDAGPVPLLAVIRPPLNDNKEFGIAVGLLQPSGQVRISFDEALSRDVCKALVGLAANGKPVVREDAYRRSLDGKHQFVQCRQLAAAR